MGGDKKCYLVSKNFNNALLHCTGDFIFLSDQDDVWLPGRVDKMVEVMEKNPDSCVVCNSVLIDMLGKVISGPLRRNGCSLSLFRQLKCPMFSGCTMAFDALFRKRVVPMPAYIPSHDAFIGLSALVVKRLFLIDETLHLYRSRDGANTYSSIHNSAVFKIAYRAYLMYAIYARLLKRRFLT